MAFELSDCLARQSKGSNTCALYMLAHMAAFTFCAEHSGPKYISHTSVFQIDEARTRKAVMLVLYHAGARDIELGIARFYSIVVSGNKLRSDELKLVEELSKEWEEHSLDIYFNKQEQSQLVLTKKDLSTLKDGAMVNDAIIDVVVRGLTVTHERNASGKQLTHLGTFYPKMLAQSTEPTEKTRRWMKMFWNSGDRKRFLVPLHVPESSSTAWTASGGHWVILYMDFERGKVRCECSLGWGLQLEEKAMNLTKMVGLVLTEITTDVLPRKMMKVGHEAATNLRAGDKIFYWNAAFIAGKDEAARRTTVRYVRSLEEAVRLESLVEL
jgi:hypothetical protein